MKYSLLVNNVTKEIKKNTIFNDVSFKLEKGKIYGLVGANGSGKSTLIKMIMGLTSFSGNISINGYNIRKEFSQSMRNIGAIVDYVSFYDYLTAEENLRYFALLHGLNCERASECMKLVNLNQDKKLVKHFSLGMKQRLGIAISLLKDPDILLLDEPTNGLDPKGIRDLRNLLFSFKDKTIIVSSHLISEIEKLTTNILFINNKKITTKSLGGDKRNVKFILGNNYQIKERYYTNDEVNSEIISLVKKKVPIYRVSDEPLEDVLISMMEEDNV